jgi:ABC-type maltose transport system permease subunit
MCDGFTEMGIFRKVLATIGVANLFLFVIIVFVSALDNRILIWILIAIESAC